MHVLLTGGSGAVGAFVGPALLAAGHEVTPLGRGAEPGRIRWDLAERPPPLPRAEALVHLAFQHVPGRYRGGEGDDPDGFWRLNRDGSRRLFEAARAAGVGRIVLLSSRAVYGDGRRGETLRETDPPAPDSLYGRMKLDLEGAADVSVRATGVYGLAPGAPSHKWSGLFADYLGGRTVAPRAATELHGADLAAAVSLLIGAATAQGAYNASDLLVDRHDLLGEVRRRTGCPHPLPRRAEGPTPGIMACDRLAALGWRPGGRERIEALLDTLLGPRAERHTM